MHAHKLKHLLKMNNHWKFYHISSCATMENVCRLNNTYSNINRFYFAAICLSACNLAVITNIESSSFCGVSCRVYSKHRSHYRCRAKVPFDNNETAHWLRQQLNWHIQWMQVDELYKLAYKLMFGIGLLRATRI